MDTKRQVFIYLFIKILIMGKLTAGIIWENVEKESFLFGYM